jgi:hypothetical protein
LYELSTHGVKKGLLVHFFFFWKNNNMNFSADEIEKAKELKKIRFQEKTTTTPQVGSYLFARHAPAHCIAVAEQIFLITERDESQKDCVWLPSFDELLEASRKMNISFSMITDYLHRKRFADGREREGLSQLLLERLR